MTSSSSLKISSSPSTTKTPNNHTITIDEQQQQPQNLYRMAAELEDDSDNEDESWMHEYMLQEKLQLQKERMMAADDFQEHDDDASSVTSSDDSDDSSVDDENRKIITHTTGPSFQDLGLAPWISQHLEKLNIVVPTQIQQKCIPETLKGKDIIGMSQTGSGKTASFALPIIDSLSKNMYGIFALILTPTRELAHQIVQHFKALTGNRLKLRISLIVGGISTIAQAQEMDRKPHIVIGTPGRVVQAIQEFTNDRYFKRIKYLVFDEADRLLSSSFAGEMEVILKACNPRRQTLLYSATMNDDVKRLSQIALQKKKDQMFLYDACKLFTIADNLQQSYIFVPKTVKDCYLYVLLKYCQENQKIAMVFFSEIRECEITAKMCELLDIRTASLHSVKSQGSRINALDSFRRRDVTALFTTDVGNRGLDIPAVDLVINYDIPDTTDEYVHRVGRSARAGRAGSAINLVTQYDVERLKSIETNIGYTMKEYNHESVTPSEKVEKYLSDVSEKKIEAKIQLIDSGFIEQHIEKKISSKEDTERRRAQQMKYEKKYNELLKNKWKKTGAVSAATLQDIEQQDNTAKGKEKQSKPKKSEPKSSVQVSGLTLLGGKKKRKRKNSNNAGKSKKSKTQ